MVMDRLKTIFLVTNFPFTLDITDEQVWRLVQQKFERDFPWLLSSGYPLVLSGVGRGWSEWRQRGHVQAHAGFRSIGRIQADALLAWITHMRDILRLSKSGRIVCLSSTPEAGFAAALAKSLQKKKYKETACDW